MSDNLKNIYLLSINFRKVNDLKQNMNVNIIQMFFFQLHAFFAYERSRIKRAFADQHSDGIKWRKSYRKRAEFAISRWSMRLITSTTLYTSEHFIPRNLHICAHSPYVMCTKTTRDECAYARDRKDRHGSICTRFSRTRSRVRAYETVVTKLVHAYPRLSCKFQIRARVCGCLYVYVCGL